MRKFSQHIQKLLDMTSKATRFQRVSFLKGDYFSLSLCVFSQVPQFLQMIGQQSTSEFFLLAMVPKLEICCQQGIATMNVSITNYVTAMQITTPWNFWNPSIEIALALADWTLLWFVGCNLLMLSALYKSQLHISAVCTHVKRNLGSNSGL